MQLRQLLSYFKQRINFLSFVCIRTVPRIYVGDAGFENSSKYKLDATPKEFRVEEFDWHCKLGYEGTCKEGNYLFWINDVLATSLPKAPPIKKDNIPVVCQSENLVILGDVIKRVTF